MHTLEEIREEYDRLDRLLGLDTSGIRLGISTRGVRRLGCFMPPAPRGGGPAKITVSAAVLEDDGLFWDTIRHEYAHAAVWLTHPGERHGHDGVWKAMCRRVGCMPRGTAPPDPALERLRRQKARYLVRCGKCGAETYYLKAGKVVKTLESGYRRRLCCGRCGGNDLKLYVREEDA